MSHHNLISYDQYLEYKKDAPEYLTTLYITMYDIEGVSSKFRAYKFSQCIQQGFFKSQEDAAEAKLKRDGIGGVQLGFVDDEENTAPMVRSSRV